MDSRPAAVGHETPSTVGAALISLVLFNSLPRGSHGLNVQPLTPCRSGRLCVVAQRLIDRYSLVPRSVSVRWLGVAGGDALAADNVRALGLRAAYARRPPGRLRIAMWSRSLSALAPGPSRLPGDGQHRMPAEGRDLSSPCQRLRIAYRS